MQNNESHSMGEAVEHAKILVCLDKDHSLVDTRRDS